ncbi:hypothetical protein GW17_00058815 [Ensete ventricosum]|nr:hypothetical protein GW17_00058815 [Ensete ventricosum]
MVHHILVPYHYTSKLVIRLGHARGDDRGKAECQADTSARPQKVQQHFGARRRADVARMPNKKPKLGAPWQIHPHPSTNHTSGWTNSLLSHGEASIVPPTPNHYWRLLNDPRLTPPAPNLGPPAMSIEAFLGLTQQVQTLAEMIQAIVPYIPQSAQALAHQRSDAPRQKLQREVLQSRLTRDEHPDNEAPHHLPN